MGACEGPPELGRWQGTPCPLQFLSGGVGEERPCVTINPVAWLLTEAGLAGILEEVGARGSNVCWREFVGCGDSKASRMFWLFTWMPRVRSR